MKNVTRIVIRLLAVSVLFAPLAGQAANETYAMTGKVLAKHSKYINVGDVHLLLSPTVKIVIPGNPQASLADIRTGHTVGVQMLQYRGKSYVDTIFKLTGSGIPANE